jgi:hypothetical protein
VTALLMRKLLLILTLCLPGIAGFGLYDGSKSGGTNNSTGFLDIIVRSNVDEQFFQYNITQQCLSFGEKPETGYTPETSISRIIIPVKEFTCINKFVYNDFLTLLKAEQYPYLEIDIPYNSSLKFNTGDSLILRNVTIIVAGVSSRYDINCKIYKVDNENKILNGTTRMKLTDIDIVPPVKVLGLVKVKNEIIINFKFCLKST